MRIIAGEFRSRKIYSPAEGMLTRPIPDRVKESLFGMLRGHCEGASVLDCFAGTGAIGLEAVSRGARECVFVERDRDAARMLQANIELLGCQDRCEVVIGDALGAGALARAPRPLTLAFFDPPYPLVLEPVGWGRVKAQCEAVVQLLSDDGFLVLRLPEPFVHEVGGAEVKVEAAPRTPARPFNKPRKTGDERFDWRRAAEAQKPANTKAGKGAKKGAKAEEVDEAEELEFVSEEELAAMMAAERAAEAATPPPPKKEFVAPSIVLAGANGPETHVYRGTAVHLYMRKR